MAIINDNFQLNYKPARISQTEKELCIVYYAWCAEMHKNKRKVMRFNHLVGKYTKRDISKIMNKAVAEINMKLEAGKNPFIEAEMPKSYSKLSDATEFFLRMKKRDMRTPGFKSYTSYCKKINEWIVNNSLKDCFVISFNKDSALEFMNELALNEGLSNRTWNNHFIFYRTLWNWLIENNYCKVNVFEGFSKKREEEKIRKVIPDQTHNRIRLYCRWFMPKFEIVIDLVRASFIRPAEIAKIQLHEINLFEQYIFIPKEKSKTHRDRYAYLPGWLCARIAENFQLERFPLDYYFVGSRLDPCVKQSDTRKYDKYWERIRRDLMLEMDMQLYSYRDTGITALEDAGVQRKVIQKLTDHTSVKMVGRYIGPPSKELIDDVVSKIAD
jgi:integrase